MSKYPVRHEVHIDIQYHRIHPSVVAEYELMDAAIFSHYTWDNFLKTPRTEQARCVAHYRSHNRLETIIQQEVSQQMRNKK